MQQPPHTTHHNTPHTTHLPHNTHHTHHNHHTPHTTTTPTYHHHPHPLTTPTINQHPPPTAMAEGCCEWPNAGDTRDAHKDCIKVFLLSCSCTNSIHAFIHLYMHPIKHAQIHNIKARSCICRYMRGVGSVDTSRSTFDRPSILRRKGTQGPRRGTSGEAHMRFDNNTHHPHTS